MGNSFDVVGRHLQHSLPQVGQGSGDREFIADLGDVAVGRIEPCQANTHQFLFPPTQPCLRPSQSFVFVDRYVDGPVLQHWTVDISIDEHEGLTRAKARLRWREKELVGVGLARLNPADRNVPEIGDELSVARALSDLGKRMLKVSTHDIEAVTHQPARLLY